MTARLEELNALVAAIAELKRAAENVARLSAGLPMAEKNSYMILQQVEMLEIEVCDPVEALNQHQTKRE